MDQFWLDGRFQKASHLLSALFLGFPPRMQHFSNHQFGLEYRRISDRLSEVVSSSFFGWQDELALLGGTIKSSDPPFLVGFIHGRAGIGKSRLIQALRCSICRQGRNRYREEAPGTVGLAVHASEYDNPSKPKILCQNFLDAQFPFRYIWPTQKRVLVNHWTN